MRFWRRWKRSGLPCFITSCDESASNATQRFWATTLKINAATWAEWQGNSTTVEKFFPNPRTTAVAREKHTIEILLSVCEPIRFIYKKKRKRKTMTLYQLLYHYITHRKTMSKRGFLVLARHATAGIINWFEKLWARNGGNSSIFEQEVCVWLRVGARTERLGHSRLRLSHPTVSSNHPLLYSNPPHAPTPPMKLQSSQTPHPRHFQYRPSSAPTPLRTRDVCEAWHRRSVLWHSTPRLCSLPLGAHSQFCVSYFHLLRRSSWADLFLFQKFNPASACREASVKSRIL